MAQEETSPESKVIEPPARSMVRTAFNVLLVLALITFSLRGPILRGLGGRLVHEDSPQKADLIVVLAGSPVVRGLAGADYYHKGFAPLIYMSRGRLLKWELVRDLDLYDTGAWDLTFRILTAKGVPPEAVIKDAAFAGNTLEEAERVKVYLKGGRVKSLILVTSRWHSRRAHMIFTRVLGPEIEVVSLPSRYDPFDPENWWRDPVMAKHVVLEYEKLAYYALKFAFD